ncbi:GntR family transcriptional regulator [Maridesulfovibrio frigidus]|uniref:GntR family transcriptional regulator n=1 Tax=Maridesulfovibrio frigidus TaxID=340956 RepID=UPI0004E189FF|nr:GntR family transcriptional regulator [Maridesulfovibrio frigidus]
MSNEEGLKRRVLRDDVVEYIIEEILRGDLKPGERVVETKVSRDLHVSQGAVREALRDLKARGFVEAEPYKGSRVKVFLAEDFEDYCKIRLELEVFAVQWAIEKDTSKVEELSAIVALMYERAKANDELLIRKADVKFHELLIDSAENKSLRIAWDALANDYWIYIGVNAEIKNFPLLMEQADKHRLIVEAISAGDLDLVRNSLESHFSIVQ